MNLVVKFYPIAPSTSSRVSGCQGESVCFRLGGGRSLIEYLFMFVFIDTTTCVHMSRCNLYAALQAIKLLWRAPNPPFHLSANLSAHLSVPCAHAQSQQ